jgi:lipoprotein-anchoring transpeptidase ErfK/SrfK
MKTASIALLVALSVPAYANPTIIVSKAQQSYSIVDNGKIIKRGKVSTGKKGYPTPSGSFVIHTKVDRAYSKKYRSWMNYVMLFKGNKYALHSGVVPGYPASHGCIRLTKNDAIYLYKSAPIGTTVIVR